MAWWGRDDDKRFEKALVLTENDPKRFETIATYLEKPLDDVMHYYNALVHDVELIESGRFGTTNYQEYADGSLSSEIKHVEKDKKRGNPWTPEEHGKFLEGLAKFGKGDWKIISRVYVKTRTSTQVASHAQKYFLRQSMESEAKKRSSIHDITLVNDDDNAEVVISAPQSDLEATMVPAHFGQQMP